MADARFCPSCGQRLTLAAPQEVAPVPLGQVPAGQAVPGGQKIAKSSAVLIVVGLILVAGLGAFALGKTGAIGSHPTIPPAGATVGPPTSAPGLSDDCVRQIGPFVSALENLNSRLAVGLSFSDYSTRVGDVRVAYDRINAAKLDQLCVTLVGSPSEDAFNAYVSAYNTWNDCVGKSGCTEKTVDAKLQVLWTKASGLIEQVKAALP